MSFFSVSSELSSDDVANSTVLKANESGIYGALFLSGDSTVKKAEDVACNMSNVNTVKLPDGAKTMLENKNGRMWARLANGSYLLLMPSVTDVSVIENNGKAKVVYVYFSDGKYEKAVLDNCDEFSLEQGISICITKKLLSKVTYGNGGSIYNKIIKNAVKVYRNKLLAEQKDAERKAVEADRMARLAKKKAAKREKREAAAREQYIQLESEAILRALQKFNNTSSEA